MLINFDDGATSYVGDEEWCYSEVQCPIWPPTYPANTGPYLRKVIEQHWTRNGDTITYDGGLDYPECRYNWSDGGYGNGCSENPYDGAQPYIYGRKSYCPRYASIVYMHEAFNADSAEYQKKLTFKGMDPAGGDSCNETERFGLAYFRTLSQPYAIAPRVPMRGVSVRNARFAPDPDTFDIPSQCRISTESCGESRAGGYIDCKDGEPLREDCTIGGTIPEEVRGFAGCNTEREGYCVYKPRWDGQEDSVDCMFLMGAGREVAVCHGSVRLLWAVGGVGRQIVGGMGEGIGLGKKLVSPVR